MPGEAVRVRKGRRVRFGRYTDVTRKHLCTIYLGYQHRNILFFRLNIVDVVDDGIIH